MKHYNKFTWMNLKIFKGGLATADIHRNYQSYNEDLSYEQVENIGVVGLKKKEDFCIYIFTKREHIMSTE